MDKSVSFAPDPRFTALAGAGFVAALVGALVTSDAAGRVIFGTAAVVLAVYVFADLVFRPRLVASSEGIVIKAPMTRARLAWSQVEAVRTDVRLRMGLRSTTLEIDAGETLAVFSRRALGRDPDEAAALIGAFRP